MKSHFWKVLLLSMLSLCLPLSLQPLPLRAETAELIEFDTGIYAGIKLPGEEEDPASELDIFELNDEVAELSTGLYYFEGEDDDEELSLAPITLDENSIVYIFIPEGKTLSLNKNITATGTCALAFIGSGTLAMDEPDLTNLTIYYGSDLDLANDMSYANELPDSQYPYSKFYLNNELRYYPIGKETGFNFPMLQEEGEVEYWVINPAGRNLPDVFGGVTYQLNVEDAKIDVRTDYTNVTGVFGTIVATPKFKEAEEETPDPTKLSATLNLNDFSGGTATLSATEVEPGGTLTVTITPDPGLIFAEMPIIGLEDMDAGTIQVPAEEDGKYIFTIINIQKDAVITVIGQGVPIPEKVNIETAVNDPAMGSATGGGEVEVGTPMKLEAIPNEYYTFKEWQLDGTTVATTPVYEFTAMASGVYTAIFEFRIENEFAITLDPNDGDPTSMAMTENQCLPNIDIFTVPRDGYVFEGWYTQPEGGTKITPDYQFTEDTTIYAHWTKKEAELEFTITFHPNGGEVSTTSAVTQNQKLKSLPSAKRDGYIFNGWFSAASDGVPVTTSTIFSADTTVYAHWTKKETAAEFTVTLDPNGGSCSQTSVTTKNQKISSLPDATRSGYTFGGWYTEKDGGEKVTSSTRFTRDVTIYARWTSKEQGVFTITLDANNGSGKKVTSVTQNGRLVGLPTLTMAGYQFEGWYTEKDGGEKVDTNTVFTGNTTIYAHWKKLRASDVPTSTNTNLALYAGIGAGALVLIAVLAVVLIKNRKK